MLWKRKNNVRKRIEEPVKIAGSLIIRTSQGRNAEVDEAGGPARTEENLLRKLKSLRNDFPLLKFQLSGQRLTSRNRYPLYSSTHQPIYSKLTASAGEPDSCPCPVRLIVIPDSIRNPYKTAPRSETFIWNLEFRIPLAFRCTCHYLI